MNRKIVKQHLEKMEKIRAISAIAQDIRADWKNPYFGAMPYIMAMDELNSIEDNYGLDSADSIVRYFLSNARTWRGEKAREIKDELKNLLHL